jgi:hypothetical protein
MPPSSNWEGDSGFACIARKRLGCQPGTHTQAGVPDGMGCLLDQIDNVQCNCISAVASTSVKYFATRAQHSQDRSRGHILQQHSADAPARLGRHGDAIGRVTRWCTCRKSGSGGQGLITGCCKVRKEDSIEQQLATVLCFKYCIH